MEKYKLDYMIVVVKSCKTNEQLRNARRWACDIIDKFNIPYHDKLDFTNQIYRANSYNYENN